MDANTLLANPDIIRLESFISEPNAITIVACSKQKYPVCPNCNQPSKSLHSNYKRIVADLPWQGVTVRIRLNTRKFRCRNELCPQKVFCERLPDVVETYARKTCRLDNALAWLAFALGGEAGARTAERLRMKTSGDTLLRMIRRITSLQSSMPFNNEPKIIGVDDWAWRKGCTYGTIIVDLEKRKVIDLLADREAGTLTNWLLAHPSVETVARDRSPTYRNGIVMGSPFATQLADRWHLLSNLGDALEKMIERLLRNRKRTSPKALELVEVGNPESEKRPAFEPMDNWQWNHLLKKSFEEMKREACRRRLLPHLPALPKIQTPAQKTTTMQSADGKSPHMKFNVRELRALCFRRQQLSEAELETVCKARAGWDEFDRAFPLVEEFVKIIRGQSSMKLSLWIVRAFDSKVRELKSFANGLQKDFLAVKEAIISSWSNGQTEGQVNRLKLLKRQMYGRAKFDLLKARVLNPA